MTHAVYILVVLACVYLGIRIAIMAFGVLTGAILGVGTAWTARKVMKSARTNPLGGRNDMGTRDTSNMARD